MFTTKSGTNVQCLLVDFNALHTVICVESRTGQMLGDCGNVLLGVPGERGECAGVRGGDCRHSSINEL